ncbi:hypothetical protein P154DRAFT_598098 [Amniculicola lignicola CBS 123094]|uniref:Uncharacterized protein n=1 Tax=Amniculicola lignicola CBS 123094 TaxID=1392246 RepID=A0A6A5WJF7_9PLEO|nr:hypothetical protein P154DRAFT_598098 [Amniculicola lignicola CBS 123094]
MAIKGMIDTYPMHHTHFPGRGIYKLSPVLGIQRFLSPTHLPAKISQISKTVNMNNNVMTTQNIQQVQAKLEALSLNQFQNETKLTFTVSSDDDESTPTTPTISCPGTPFPEEMSPLERLIDRYYEATDTQMGDDEASERHAAVADYLYHNPVTLADVKVLVPRHIFRHVWINQMSTNIALFYGRGNISEEDLEEIHKHLFLEAVPAIVGLSRRRQNPRIRKCQQLHEIVCNKVEREKTKIEENILNELARARRKQRPWVKKHPWAKVTNGKPHILIRRDEQKAFWMQVEKENLEICKEIDARSIPFPPDRDKKVAKTGVDEQLLGFNSLNTGEGVMVRCTPPLRRDLRRCPIVPAIPYALMKPKR